MAILTRYHDVRFTRFFFRSASQISTGEHEQDNIEICSCYQRNGDSRSVQNAERQFEGLRRHSIEDASSRSQIRHSRQLSERLRIWFIVPAVLEGRLPRFLLWQVNAPTLISWIYELKLSCLGGSYQTFRHHFFHSLTFFLFLSWQQTMFESMSWDGIMKVWSLAIDSNSCELALLYLSSFFPLR